MKEHNTRRRDFYKIVPWVILLFFIGFLFMLAYNRIEMTGRISLGVQKGNYYTYETISGTFELTLNAYEYIPAETIVKAEIGGQESILTLEELIIASNLDLEKQQGNFSVENVNISGSGEAYGSEGGTTLALNLSAFSLMIEESGNYDFYITLVYDDITMLTSSAKIKIKSCTPNWKEKDTSCEIDDTKIGYYIDKKECYEKTGYIGYLEDRPENTTSSCDYCKPKWKKHKTECIENDTKIAYYEDKKECYSKTNLDSDLLDKPENETIECDYCTPKLKEYNTSCSINDTFIVWYKDKKDCYEKTGLESDKVPENKTYICDFCLPEWAAVNTSCLPGDMIIQWYNDSNDCYEKTGLDSDLDGRPENTTYKLSCDYEGNNIIGSISDITTEITNLSLIISDSEDLTQSFTDMQRILIKEDGFELLGFDFNFSVDTLRLAGLAIEKQDGNATKGFVVVNGINLSSQNKTKTIWIDRLLEGASICIIDKENVDAGSISASCNGSDEVLAKCPGSEAGYVCEIDTDLNRYKVSGLIHSGIIEQDAFCGDGACSSDETCSVCSTDCGACPALSTPASSGGGGGGSYSRCESNWSCTEWNECVDGRQARTCTDNHNCVKPANKPEEEQECEAITSSESGSIEEQEKIDVKAEEATQARPGILGGVIGIIAVMPFGVKISIILTLVSLIFALIAVIIFLALIKKRR